MTLSRHCLLFLPFGVVVSCHVLYSLAIILLSTRKLAALLYKLSCGPVATVHLSFVSHPRNGMV